MAATRAKKITAETSEAAAPIVGPWLFLHFVLIAIGVVALAILGWRLAPLLVLVFAALLFAIMLRAIADPIAARTPLGATASLALAILVVVAVLAAFGFVLGTQLRAQLTDLGARLPELERWAEQRLGVPQIGKWLERLFFGQGGDGALAANVAGMSSMVLGTLGDVAVVMVAGAYLAADPRLYRRGALLIFPRSVRGEAGRVFDALGGALRLWLLGQLVAMTIVGTLTTLGLWLLGIPSALALGFIAGIMEFVPLVGPVLSAVPAVAVAAGGGNAMALWVVALYVAVQQLEGYVITPLVQQRAVDLPPALMLFAIVAFGMLLGPFGVFLASPLAVTCFVAVKALWVQDVLDEDTEIPGTKPDA